VWHWRCYTRRPEALISKAPSADLEANQNGRKAISASPSAAPDAILAQAAPRVYSDSQLVEHGFDAADVALVRRRVETTHWKRHLPTTAMLTQHRHQRVLLAPGRFFDVSLSADHDLCHL